MISRAKLKDHPIHPMLVAFPIALWVTAFVFDLLGRWLVNDYLWAAGFYAIVAGIVGAVAAAIPGVVDLFSVVPPNSSARKRGYMHGALNTVVLIVFLAIAIRRGGAAVMPDNTSLLLSAIALVILGVAGWMGGTLVYRNHIGVVRRYAGASKLITRTLDSWDRPVCGQTELAEGQMMLAIIEGQRVVVGRCSEGVVAFSDYCTHKGGPLHDGVMMGCAVQCPWHGSNFDVLNGRVIAGPAEEKIATYKVQVRGNEVYVLQPPHLVEQKRREEEAARPAETPDSRRPPGKRKSA